MTTPAGSINQTNTYAAAPIPHIWVTLGLGQLDAVGGRDKHGGRLHLRSRKGDDRQPWGGAMPLAQLSIVDGRRKCLLQQRSKGMRLWNLCPMQSRVDK